MLPQQLRENYQQFQYALKHLETTLAAQTFEREALKDNFQVVQGIFQSQIAHLSNDAQNIIEVPRQQSFQTEIHRLFRLMEMDVMFLQASRSSATTQARQTAMSERVKNLIGYCEALLQQE